MKRQIQISTGLVIGAIVCLLVGLASQKPTEWDELDRYKRQGMTSKVDEFWERKNLEQIIRAVEREYQKHPNRESLNMRGLCEAFVYDAAFREADYSREAERKLVCGEQ